MGALLVGGAMMATNKNDGTREQKDGHRIRARARGRQALDRLAGG